MAQGDGLGDLFVAAQQEGNAGDRARLELEARPALTPYETIVWEAFGELSSERSTGMGVGPIPWCSIVAYGQYHGFAKLDAVTGRGRAVDHFIREIQALDRVFVAAMAKKAKSQST